MTKGPEYTIKSKKDLSYKILLLLISIVLACIVCALVFVAYCLFQSDRALCLLCLAAALALVVLWAVFFRWIYSPIIKIEQALQIFEAYGEDFSVSIDRYSDTWPIAHSLNRIHSRLRESIDREYIAHMKQKDAEIHALQSQINPHFLYNTLDSIRGLALINNDEEVAEMTEALSVFFRYSIGQKGHIVTLREELENIKSYLLIQNNRFKDKLFFNVLIDGDEEQIMRYQFPKLLLQPVIENAVYHGIEPKIGPGHITIRIFTTETQLVVNVQDDGIGMEESELQALKEKLRGGKYVEEPVSSHGNGIALININQRIILNYGEHYGLTLSSTKGIGSEVELTLPIICEENS
nr:sensor histidine kinase [uncultured Oscillibacter sp.]